MSNVNSDYWPETRSNSIAELSPLTITTSSTIAGSDYAHSINSYYSEPYPASINAHYRHKNDDEVSVATWNTQSIARESPGGAVRVAGSVAGSGDGGALSSSLVERVTATFERKQVLERLLKEEMTVLRSIFRPSLEEHIRSRPEMRYRLLADDESVMATDAAIAVAEFITQQGHVDFNTARKLSTIALYHLNIFLGET